MSFPYVDGGPELPGLSGSCGVCLALWLGKALTLSAVVMEATSPEGGAAHVVAFCG